MADVVVRNEGTLFLFEPMNDIAREVLEAAADPQQWFGSALVVEHRYAMGFAEFLMNEYSLEVE